VIPEATRQLVRALRAPQLLEDRAPTRLATNGVAAHALLRLENRLPALRIPGDLRSGPDTRGDPGEHQRHPELAEPTVPGDHFVALAV
jgi:hypothetical protein